MYQRFRLIRDLKTCLKTSTLHLCNQFTITTVIPFISRDLSYKYFYKSLSYSLFLDSLLGALLKNFPYRTFPVELLLALLKSNTELGDNSIIIYVNTLSEASVRRTILEKAAFLSHRNYDIYPFQNLLHQKPKQENLLFNFCYVLIDYTFPFT